MAKRNRYSAEFKAKVSLEAIREEMTMAEMAKKYDIHLTMISGWKRTTIENMAAAFGGASPAAPQISEKEVDKLHGPRSAKASSSDIFCWRPPVSFVSVSRASPC